MKHRPDIDGLRCVAIVPVVLFHAGVPGVPGGFVGVDVFFVISGYLITHILLEDLERGEGTIVRFYERRVRRIFPALFATMAFCLVVASALFLPDDLEQLGEAALAATFFVSNLFFWTEFGYFDAPAELKPLLHTWSLAVEEQFYILYPLYLVVLSRWWAGLRRPLTLALLVASLVLSEWLAQRDAGAFFLTPARGFELLVGACLALGCFPAFRGRLQHELAAAAGALMIAWSVLGFSAATVFPGLHALVPCLGAALLIHAGTSGAPRISRWLGTPPIVFVGLISYSLYLWHWPLLVFAKYYLIRELHGYETLVVIAASVVISVLSWRFVERPFRGRAAILSRRRVFVAGGSAMAGVAALSLTLVVTDGLPERLSPEVATLAAGSEDWSIDRCGGRTLGEVERGELCRLGVRDGRPPTFLVWGDSHGAMLDAVFDSAAAEAGRSGLLFARGGCLPLFGVGMIRPGFHQTCIDFGEAVARLLAATPSIETVILVARWALYATGERVGPEKGDLVVIGTADASATSPSANLQIFNEGLTRAVQRLRGLGVRPVIVGPVPEVGWSVPSALARSRMFDVPLDIAPSLDEFLVRQKDTRPIFARLREEYGVLTVYPHEILCPGEACQIVRDGRPLYFDSDHLTLFGSGLLGGMFRSVLEEDSKVTIFEEEGCCGS